MKANKLFFQTVKDHCKYLSQHVFKYGHSHVDVLSLCFIFGVSGYDISHKDSLDQIEKFG